MNLNDFVSTCQSTGSTIDHLRRRQLGYDLSTSLETILQCKESVFLRNCTRSDVTPNQGSDIISTIAISFSEDGTYVATTNGDHTVKIFNFSTNSLERVFEGHSRTPWTVKFHPRNSNVLASGCLGSEVRVWDIALGKCVAFLQKANSIISLSFHPMGDCIAVVSGQMLHMFHWVEEPGTVPGQSPHLLDPTQFKKRYGSRGDNSITPMPRYMRNIYNTRNIRAVLFHPKGEYIFIASPPFESIDGNVFDQKRSNDCRLHAVRLSELALSRQEIADPMQRDGHDVALGKLPVLLPYIHLYGDGGLDISADGTRMITCVKLRHIAPPGRRHMVVESAGAQAFGGVENTTLHVPFGGEEETSWTNRPTEAHQMRIKREREVRVRVRKVQTKSEEAGSRQHHRDMPTLLRSFPQEEQEEEQEISDIRRAPEALPPPLELPVPRGLSGARFEAGKAQHSTVFRVASREDVEAKEKGRVAPTNDRSAMDPPPSCTQNWWFRSSGISWSHAAHAVSVSHADIWGALARHTSNRLFLDEPPGDTEQDLEGCLCLFHLHLPSAVSSNGSSSSSSSFLRSQSLLVFHLLYCSVTQGDTPLLMHDCRRMQLSQLSFLRAIQRASSGIRME